VTYLGVFVLGLWVSDAVTVITHLDAVDHQALVTFGLACALTAVLLK
jgi:hypothetical protein